MEALSKKHLGASAYQTTAFDEPGVIVAPVESLLHRVAAWLTKPIGSIDFDQMAVAADKSDPGRYVRESMDDAFRRDADPFYPGSSAYYAHQAHDE